MTRDESRGRIIRETRIAAGLSQAQLAERIGYANQTSVSYLERGETRITVDLVGKIATACGVPEPELIARLSSEAASAVA